MKTATFQIPLQAFLWEEQDLSQRKFLTVIETGPESFGAFAPDIQGCVAFSKLREEVGPLFKLAAESHLRELFLSGERLPEPQSTGIRGIEIGVPTGAITLEWTTVELPLAA